MSKDKYYYDLTYNTYDPQAKRINVLSTVAYMLNRTRRMFKYKGLPETIPERELELMLQRNGHCFITEYKGKLYAFTGELGGKPDEYYRPTEYIVANPAFNLNKSFKIGIDGVLIRNDSLMVGLLPLLNKYAALMVENELTIANVEVLARAMLVFTADKENDLGEVQKFIDNLRDGKLIAIGTEKLLTKTGTVDVQPGAAASASIITQLIELQQYLKGSWWNEIGLNANWNAKRENITNSENMLNDDALLPLYDDFKECRVNGFDEVNIMYNTNIVCESASAWEDNEIEIENAQNAQYEEDPQNEETEKNAN